MFEISSAIYEETARKMLEALDDREFFSGSVAFASGDTECRLTATLIVRHETHQCPDGCHTVIGDIVPVWWEFATVSNGVEVLNDFSFTTLKEFII